MAAAAAAYAAGQSAPEEAAQLAGRRFEIRLPFGCHGVSDEEARLRYAWNPEKRRLKLTAEPTDFSEMSWFTDISQTTAVEATEGFWISRPWLTTEVCPAQTSTTSPPPPETVALVQAFDAESSRLPRRQGRAYEVTRRLPENDAPPEDGYQLVLAGRLVHSEDAVPIRCHSDGGDQRPTCIAQVEFERIAFEKAPGEIVAEWTR